jgi:hypothetical protein
MCDAARCLRSPSLLLSTEWRFCGSCAICRYYAALLLVSLAYSVFAANMFVSQMAFFARVSDPAIGGTYMTLLNTIANLGSLLSKQIVTYGVDFFSYHECIVDSASIGSCVIPSGSKEDAVCAAAAGSCELTIDVSPDASSPTRSPHLECVAWRWSSARLHFACVCTLICTHACVCTVYSRLLSPSLSLQPIIDSMFFVCTGVLRDAVRVRCIWAGVVVFLRVAYAVDSKRTNHVMACARGAVQYRPTHRNLRDCGLYDRSDHHSLPQSVIVIGLMGCVDYLSTVSKTRRHTSPLHVVLLCTVLCAVDDDGGCEAV